MTTTPIVAGVRAGVSAASEGADTLVRNVHSGRVRGGLIHGALGSVEVA